jgi:DNA-binding CsgD family transcriptional regulator
MSRRTNIHQHFTTELPQAVSTRFERAIRLRTRRSKSLTNWGEGRDLIPERRSLSSLTTREFSICTLVAAGYSTRQTAAQLWISPKTVEFHLGRAYRKIGVTNRAQLTRTMVGVQRF